MGRRVTVDITLTFDEENLADLMGADEEPITDQYLMDWARDTFIDDIHNLVKFNQVLAATRVTLHKNGIFPHEHPAAVE